MFIHYFVGGMIFTLFFGYSPFVFLIGAILGAMPDNVSLLIRLLTKRHLRFNKWAHLHRDALTHSLLMAMIGALAFSLAMESWEGFAANPSLILPATLLALLSHPIIDTFDLGWGVKLFYPLSNKYYKLFYKGKLVTIWTEEEQKAEAEKYGRDDWLWSIALNPGTAIGKSEWLSIVGLIAFLIILPLMGK